MSRPIASERRALCALVSLDHAVPIRRLGRITDAPRTDLERALVNRETAGLLVAAGWAFVAGDSIWLSMRGREVALEQEGIVGLRQAVARCGSCGEDIIHEGFKGRSLELIRRCGCLAEARVA